MVVAYYKAILAFTLREYKKKPSQNGRYPNWYLISLPRNYRYVLEHSFRLYTNSAVDTQPYNNHTQSKPQYQIVNYIHAESRTFNGTVMSVLNVIGTALDLAP